MTYRWVYNYTKREDKIQGRGNGSLAFICNISADLDTDPDATHQCFFTPIGLRITNVRTPMKPGRYGPINARFFNLTQFEVTINFRAQNRTNYTLLYEDNFYIDIKPAYLLSESN